MSEAVQLAKAAREQLAQALNALQSDDKVPVDLVAVAEPIAKAMTVLHRVERSNGENLEGRDGALVAVRSALEQVQKVNDAHPSVDVVMEAVAASLSKVHALARYTPPAARTSSAPASAPIARPTPAPPAPIAQPPSAPVRPITRPPSAPPAPIARPPSAPPAPIARPPSAPPAPSAPSAPIARPPSAPPRPIEAAPAPPAPIARPPSAPPAPVASAPAPQPVAPPPPQVPAAFAPQQAPSGSAREPSQPSRPGSVRPAAPPASIDVELGTHSSSNFYKGLGGNDVIEHGGIFVATYKVPKIGALVSLRVLLPGDYEFHASAVVQWTREGASTEPGFGARFTQISQDGRQLVYRYTRNREPMFYDDL